MVDQTRLDIAWYAYDLSCSSILILISEERKPERLCLYWRTKWKFLVEVDSREWGQFMCDSDCISNPKNSILSHHRWEGAVYWVGTGEASLGLGYLKYLKNGGICCWWTSHHAWNFIKMDFFQSRFKLACRHLSNKLLACEMFSFFLIMINLMKCYSLPVIYIHRRTVTVHIWTFDFLQWAAQELQRLQYRTHVSFSLLNAQW
jgi:hypothetical protein